MGIVALGLMIRIVAYALMVPAALVLAVGAYNEGHGRMAGLFAAFSLGHMLTLLVVVFDLYRVDSDGVRIVLTPVVVVQAALYVWIVIRRLGRRKQAADNEYHTMGGNSDD